MPRLKRRKAEIFVEAIERHKECRGKPITPRRAAFARRRRCVRRERGVVQIRISGIVVKYHRKAMCLVRWRATSASSCARLHRNGRIDIK